MHMGVRPPITFFGSKSTLAPRIIAHFPPHATYCEVFAGSAAVLLAKEPSAVEVLNDANGDIINLFRVLREPSLFRQLKHVAESTLYARAEFDLAGVPTEDPVERARRFLVRQRMSHGGNAERWSYSITDSQAKMASVIRRFRAGVERLPAIHARLKMVQIEMLDWREILDKFDRPTSLFYLDPPYLPSERIWGGYKHEMSIDDHRELVDRLLSIQGMVVLSGYQNPIYAPLEAAGWERKSFDVTANSSDTRTSRVESLWLSASIVKALRTPGCTPADQMREGAYATHRARTTATEAKVKDVVNGMRSRGVEINISMVASTIGMSREHLSRRYSYLFSSRA
jgi:DNA adenine methylase